MALSLGAIEEHLFQVLARINPAAASHYAGVPPGAPRTGDNGAVVRYVGRWVGEPVRQTPVTDFFRAAIMREVTDRTPAILLGYDGEVSESITVRTLAGRTESVGLSTWSVLLIVTDKRETRIVLHGTPAGTDPTLGTYDLLALVEPVIVGVPVPGSYRNQPTRYMDVRSYLTAPGELYVTQLRIQVRRVLEDASTLVVGRPPPMLVLAGQVNTYPKGLADDFGPLPTLSMLSYPGGAPPTPYYPPLRGLLARFDALAVNGVDRADQPRPVPSDRQPVAEWADRHSGQWQLAQAEPALQPTYALDVIHDNPAIRFDGNRVLETRVDWLPVGAEERTLAVLCGSFDGLDPATDPTLVEWGTDAPGQRFRLALTLGATPGFTLDAGGDTQLHIGVDPESAPFWIVVARYTGTTLRLLVYGNGMEGPLQASLAATLDTVSTTLTVGRGLTGSILEVDIYRCALTDEEVGPDGRAGYAGYATARYGGAGEGTGDLGLLPTDRHLWLRADAINGVRSEDGSPLPLPDDGAPVETMIDLQGGPSFLSEVGVMPTFVASPVPRVMFAPGQSMTSTRPGVTPTATTARTWVLIGSGWSPDPSQTYAMQGGDGADEFGLGVSETGDYAWRGGTGAPITVDYGVGTIPSTNAMLAVRLSAGALSLSYNGGPWVAAGTHPVDTGSPNLYVLGGQGTQYALLELQVYGHGLNEVELAMVAAYAVRYRITPL